MTAPDPGLTALLDQAAAANAEADSLVEATLASACGAGRNATWHATVELAPAERAVITRLADRLIRGNITRCPHLPPGITPCWWAPWAPGRLRCPPCLAAAASRIRGTRENDRCDHCRRWSPPLDMTARRLSPVTAEFGHVGPVVVLAGYCRTCSPRPVTT